MESGTKVTTEIFSNDKLMEGGIIIPTKYIPQIAKGINFYGKGAIRLYIRQFFRNLFKQWNPGQR